MILVIIYTILEAARDGTLLLNGCRWQDHSIAAMQRVFTLLVISMLTGLHPLLCILLFYVIFDYLLNLTWKQPILHIGTTAWLDRQWWKLGVYAPYYQLTFKILLLCVIYLLS